ncbi:FAD-binding oxidoreductase [Mycolicibacterium hodleri]|uniref:FAD-binding protein n=1 Tax=Mycolicibacterium hodleri TaxID=49897 RepID=A0A502EF85_9MYCO|nr:FAD-binding protein [Mycolicibacterium hodleri]TPG35001.1 FAD-binding protein [Mycolicibacterium hodleri]
MTAIDQRHDIQRPGSLAETAQLLRESTGTVLIRGGGTKLDWAGRVSDPDITLDTTGLAGVLTHNPGDMTASVLAGTTLAALQDHLADSGQWLALDPPSAGSGATLGGLLATGDSGPSRLRCGGLRDLVIGVTLILADGTVARSGGHVIKNVAGYDLGKLVYGSLGSLAMVAEVVVRLHPRPAASLTAAATADAKQATAAALALTASPLEPDAVEWVSGGPGEPGRLLVRFDGTQGSVEAAAVRSAALLADLGIDASPVEDAASEWQGHAAAVRGADDQTIIGVAGLPSGLAVLAERTFDSARRAGLEAHIVSSAALGIHTVALRGDSAAAHAQVLSALREHAATHQTNVLLRQRSAEVDALVEPLGPAPSTVALLRRIKAQFDPDGRWAPGRFAPWY